jgi:hypothetical protein
VDDPWDTGMGLLFISDERPKTGHGIADYFDIY